LRNKGGGVRHDKSQFRQGVDYYTEFKEDIGNQDEYEDYLSMFIEIMKKVFNKLRNRKYCSIIISDFTVNKEEKDVGGDIIRGMEKIGFKFKGRITLTQDNKAIYPFGYPYSYIMNHTNQFILNFRKDEK
jgi:hypothetical protein